MNKTAVYVPSLVFFFFIVLEFLQASHSELKYIYIYNVIFIINLTEHTPICHWFWQQVFY